MIINSETSIKIELTEEEALDFVAEVDNVVSKFCNNNNTIAGLEEINTLLTLKNSLVFELN